MTLNVELFDQFGKLETQDSFSASFDSPLPVSLSESVGVELFGGINEAGGSLNTSFAGNTLSGNASLALAFGNFPSNLAGSSINRIEVSFELAVDKSTPFSFDFAIGPAAGGTGLFLDDLWLFGSDGSVIAQLGVTGFGNAASGTGTFLPGVTYEFLAVLANIDDLDNIDPLLSSSTAFNYEIVIIPGPGTAALLLWAVPFLTDRRRRR